MLAEQALPSNLSTQEAVAWLFLGIVISIFLPLAAAAVRAATAGGGSRGDLHTTDVRRPGFWSRITTAFSAAWRRYAGGRYLLGVLGAAFLAVVIVLLGYQFTAIKDAVAAGIAWESILKKISTSKS